jgi:hypothetical protein
MRNCDDTSPGRVRYATASVNLSNIVITLMLEKAGSSESLVEFFQMTHRNISEDTIFAVKSVGTANLTRSSVCLPSSQLFYKSTILLSTFETFYFLVFPLNIFTNILGSCEIMTLYSGQEFNLPGFQNYVFGNVFAPAEISEHKIFNK